jgi:hypothetical protein
MHAAGRQAGGSGGDGVAEYRLFPRNLLQGSGSNGAARPSLVLASSRGRDPGSGQGLHWRWRGYGCKVRADRGVRTTP